MAAETVAETVAAVMVVVRAVVGMEVDAEEAKVVAVRGVAPEGQAATAVAVLARSLAEMEGETAAAATGAEYVAGRRFQPRRD